MQLVQQQIYVYIIAYELLSAQKKRIERTVTQDITQIDLQKIDLMLMIPIPSIFLADLSEFGFLYGTDLD
jgi:hypothetical protein